MARRIATRDRMNRAPYLNDDDVTLYHADSLELLLELEPNSIDAIVTDPPYELGFMGNAWDGSGIAYNVHLWRRCLRVLKPGGYLLAFGGTRTSHRMTCAIEDAGFQIRDSLIWIYGSGFPKSHNVAMMIDKKSGAPNRGRAIPVASTYQASDTEQANRLTANKVEPYAPVSPDAQQWQGWGTALKPAHEPITMARKPFTGTVAENVLKNGAGAINVDGCRIAGGESRWPANILLDEPAAAHLDAQEPNVSRFFYIAKPNRAERDAGIQTAAQPVHRLGAGIGEGHEPDAPAMNHNFHPTVKPVALMRHLVKLVTPTGGTVLDPFAGSGTTLVAARQESLNAIGIEITKEYLPIIAGRLSQQSLF